VRKVLLLILSINLNVALAQVPVKDQTQINGEVFEKINDNDSIYFINGFIDKKYFEISFIASGIKDKKFNLETRLSYPHMFRVQFKSDRGIIALRGGEYFIDASTHFIKVNSFPSCGEVVGQTSYEYKTSFVPFFFNNNESDCTLNNLETILFNRNSSKFDSILLKYVNNNPDSYVALWNLIERFYFSGHSFLAEKTLHSFSKKMKNELLWKQMHSDFTNLRIREGYKFPNLNLKTNKLKEYLLMRPQAKYTLIDFWFSRCRPCLESLPTLKKLYDTYSLKGFEIIGISTDVTNDISNWDRVIKEKEIKWPQYLDENGIEAQKEFITRFPTTFLLNEEGKIIKKNIPLDELELFLKENIK